MTQLPLPLRIDRGLVLAEEVETFLADVTRARRQRRDRRIARIEARRARHPYELAHRECDYDGEALEDVAHHVGAEVLWPGCLN